jgi:ABC-type multidrug transport system ATPase subunit
MAALTSLTDVAKRYRFDRPWVLKDVGLVVRPGAVVEVRGVNGAGKSTLLRLLAGASLPSRGRRETAPGIAIGYAPERLAPPPFTAVEYLRHHARIRRTPERDTDVVVERLGFTSLLGERMGALSKGSLQKVVLAQALAGDPRLLVLDEPFSGLDADAREALAEIVRERARDGAAVVYSDHGEAGQTRPQADETWLIDGGRVGAGQALRRAATAAFELDASESDRALADAIARGAHVRRVQPLPDGRVRIEVEEP